MRFVNEAGKMEPLLLRGAVWKYGDNLDSECMVPARLSYGGEMNDEVLARNALYGIDPDFSTRVSPGDIVVAGINCGYGSSRSGYHVRALKATKIGGIVAESLSALFLRSCVNDGLPAWACKGIASFADEGDVIEVNLESGEVKNLTRGKALRAAPMSRVNLEIVKTGGIRAYCRRRLESIHSSD